MCLCVCACISVKGGGGHCTMPSTNAHLRFGWCWVDGELPRHDMGGVGGGGGTRGI